MLNTGSLECSVQKLEEKYKETVVPFLNNTDTAALQLKVSDVRVTTFCIWSEDGCLAQATAFRHLQRDIASSLICTEGLDI